MGNGIFLGCATLRFQLFSCLPSNQLLQLLACVAVSTSSHCSASACHNGWWQQQQQSQQQKPQLLSAQSAASFYGSHQCSTCNTLTPPSQPPSIRRSLVSCALACPNKHSVGVRSLTLLLLLHPLLPQLPLLLLFVCLFEAVRQAK